MTGSFKFEIQALVQQLNTRFALKDLGEVDYFLGIQVKHTTDGLHLSQTKYVTDLLCKTKMQYAKELPTPMSRGEKLSCIGSDPIGNPQLYRSIVRALQYVTITQPKLAYSVNRICQFMQNPLESHWKVIKRILKYLRGTLDHGLHLKRSMNLDITGFCDADWASNLDERRSTIGFYVYLGSNMIYWNSNKQNTVSRSSTVAEYRSLATLAAKVT